MINCTELSGHVSYRPARGRSSKSDVTYRDKHNKTKIDVTRFYNLDVDKRIDNLASTPSVDMKMIASP